MSDATAATVETPAPPTEPEPIKPPRRRSHHRKSGSSGGSARTTTTTARLEPGAPPKKTPAQVKAGKEAAARYLALGIDRAMWGTGFATGHPDVWSLSPAERAQVEDTSRQAVDLMGGATVAPESLLGRVLAIAERYAPWAVIAESFGRILVPRILAERLIAQMLAAGVSADMIPGTAEFAAAMATRGNGHDSGAAPDFPDLLRV